MYDLIVIGGGPAGYHAAAKAGEAGLRTLLVEKSALGGVCLNEGCIPSKTMLHSSKLYYTALHGRPYGVNVDGVSIDMKALQLRKQGIIESMRKGIAFTLKKAGVVIQEGEAFILPKQGELFQVKTPAGIFEGRRLLICTGSEAIMPSIPGIGEPYIITNREALSITNIPQTMVVIGGGVIGLEMATFFAEAGSKVTIVELLPFIGGALDRDIGSVLQKELEKKGITFLLETRVTGFADHSVIYEKCNVTNTLNAEVVLVSVGRRPFTKGLGLENVGISLEGGAIDTDTYCRTSVSGIWAAGDVTGKCLLAHAAYKQGEIAVGSMLDKHLSMNYALIPSVIYTHPEAASVGYTKEQAEKEGIEVAVVKLPMGANGRYCAETSGERGMCKMVIDKKNDVICGVHLVGGACSEIIYGAGLIIGQRCTIGYIKETIFPHPTVSEVLKDALSLLP